MPKAGSRPYECIRRAWHSERHQSIRGSLIQEIFSIANEIHRPTTKKNKEWQEKLPIVVLKAEEIMYSKANTEAEYLDLKTLEDRTNDAINIIIRRDESSEETGVFLQPCIEAALHLGCIPRRASRSQRNDHSGGYLTGNVHLGNATEGNPRVTSSLAPHYLNFLGNDSPNFVLPINSCISNEMPFLSSQKCLPLEPLFPSQSSPVYPLYYGVYPPQPVESLQKFGASTSSSMNIDHLKMGIPHNLSLFNDQNKRIEKESLEPINDPHESECDLSLRLGLGSVKECKDVGSGGSHQVSNKGLSLFGGTNNGPMEEVELMVRKRKVFDQTHQRYPWQPKASEQTNDQCCPWQPKEFEQAKDPWYPWQSNLVPTYFNGRSRTAGL